MVEKDRMHVALKKAWEILRKCRPSLPVCEAAVEGALGRTLARDVISKRNVPHYNASAMDGYSLSSVKTAGAAPSSPALFPPGEYEWVNTGGDVHPRFDSVAMVENTSLNGETGVLSVVSTGCRRISGLWRTFSGAGYSQEGDTVTRLCSLLKFGVGTVAVFPLRASIFHGDR